MTSEDIRAELEKYPFRPIRLHLVSGKVVDVTITGAAWKMQNAIMVLQDPSGNITDRYDVVSLRNIERLEQLQEGDV